MKEEIVKKLKEQLKETEWKKIQNRVLQLGIFTEPYLTAMINGQKTIESRFSKNKIIPYQQINKNDIILIKKSGGPIIGYFTILKVLFFNLKETSIEELKEKYQKELCVQENFWQEKNIAIMQH